MHYSTRIFLVYSAVALIMVVASCFLTYQVWEWKPASDTLGYDLRLIALATLPLVGLSQAIQIIGDPLAWRVIRMLRRKERHISVPST